MEKKTTNKKLKKYISLKLEYELHKKQGFTQKTFKDYIKKSIELNMEMQNDKK